MAARFFDANVAHSAVLHDLEEQSRGTTNALSPSRFRISWQLLIPSQRACKAPHASPRPFPASARPQAPGTHTAAFRSPAEAGSPRAATATANSGSGYHWQIASRRQFSGACLPTFDRFCRLFCWIIGWRRAQRICSSRRWTFVRHRRQGTGPRFLEYFRLWTRRWSGWRRTFRCG